MGEWEPWPAAQRPGHTLHGARGFERSGGATPPDLRSSWLLHEWMFLRNAALARLRRGTIVFEVGKAFIMSNRVWICTDVLDDLLVGCAYAVYRFVCGSQISKITPARRCTMSKYSSPCQTSPSTKSVTGLLAWLASQRSPELQP